MINLLKNIDCYNPSHIGKKDIWIVGNKIYKILPPDSYPSDHPLIKLIPCDDLIAFPGIIDGHVHITGGGGEEGYGSCIGEIDIKDIFKAGITTVVGLLGTDKEIKSLKSLLAKARVLEDEGITTFLYSGSYELPIITLTGDIATDMVLVDKVIGAGEVAISDHRSSCPGVRELLDLACKAHVAGLISGKPGLLHIHVGDGKDGIDLLEQVVDESDLPLDMFLPTHLNRSPRLFNQGIEYVKKGGNIDLTSGEDTGISVPDAIQILLENGADMSRITVSSDANGSIPSGGVGKIQTLYTDIINCIIQKHFDPELIFSLVTKNPAKRIKQYPVKGMLSEGSDADILILDKDYQINKLFSMGKMIINDGKLLKNSGGIQNA